MERISDIGIVDFDDKYEMDIVINGYAIADIHYGSNTLIKNKEEAIEVAKKVVDIVELIYGEVKNEDYPNSLKLPSVMACVEGYEIPQYENEEEDEEGMAHSLSKLAELMCQCQEEE